MTRENALAEILEEISQAHQQAFKQTHEHDREWSKWYAARLLRESDFKRYVPGLNEETLSHLLEMLHQQYKSDRTRLEWSQYYSRKLLKIH